MDPSPAPDAAAVQDDALPNGSAAAAILAAGVACFTLGALALAGDASPAFNKAMVFYGPTGALSGVSTVAVLIWAAAWVLLDLRWRRRTVALRTVNLAAFSLLGASLLLTFPPFMDWLQGR